MRTRLEDKDGDWLRSSFLLPRTTVNLRDQRKNLFRETGIKFTDSSLGGNYYINPLPQFTEYADVVQSIDSIADPHGEYSSDGMGRLHSDMYDDNAQVIYMRFGVPEYNGITTFMTSFYSSEASLLARTGRAPGFFYNAGRLVGFVASIPLWPIIMSGTAYRWAMNNPASKFYYMKPTMPLYWNVVNSLVNRMAVDMGIVPMVFSDEQKKYLSGEMTSPDADSDLMAAMHRAEPDIYWKGGGIDIYTVANKATRKAHKVREALKQLQEDGGTLEEMGIRMKDYLESSAIPTSKSNAGGGSLDNVLNEFLVSQAGTIDPAVTGSANSDSVEEKTGRATLQKDGTIKEGWFSSLIDYTAAELADGSAFIGFRVNATGSVSESFSSTTKASDLQGSINSRSSQARSTRFSFAGGNIGDNPLANGLETILGVAKDVVMGTADGLQISGIAALFGSAFVDIPEHWDDSSFNHPSASYTIHLRSPYGNKLSRFNNLMVPLLAILAGTLPLSAGTHSYTSPFMCELWSKGRVLIRSGMIKSLSITRGEGNLGWTNEDEPLGIDVTFEVVDLSTIMHMPIASESFFNPINQIFSEDSSFSDYMATLASMSMTDQFYISRRWKLALTRSMISYRSWLSPGKYANWFNGTRIGRLGNMLSREVERP